MKITAGASDTAAGMCLRKSSPARPTPSGEARTGASSRKSAASSIAGADLTTPSTDGRPSWSILVTSLARSSSMSSEVTDLISALRRGDMTLDEVAQHFRTRAWPRRQTPGAGTYLELATTAEQDPEDY